MKKLILAFITIVTLLAFTSCANRSSNKKENTKATQIEKESCVGCDSEEKECSSCEGCNGGCTE